MSNTIKLSMKIIKELNIDRDTVTLIEKLDKENLGEPSKFFPKEGINPLKTNGTKPQAWEKN